MLFLQMPCSVRRLKIGGAVIATVGLGLPNHEDSAWGKFSVLDDGGIFVNAVALGIGIVACVSALQASLIVWKLGAGAVALLALELPPHPYTQGGHYDMAPLFGIVLWLLTLPFLMFHRRAVVAEFWLAQAAVFLAIFHHAFARFGHHDVGYYLGIAGSLLILIGCVRAALIRMNTGSL